jgi:hypothetical protein
LPFNIVEFYYSKIFTFDFTVILQHNPKLIFKDNNDMRLSQINNIITILRSNLNCEKIMLLPNLSDDTKIFQLEYFNLPNYWFETSVIFKWVKYKVKNNKLLFFFFSPFYRTFKFIKIFFNL